MTSLEVAVEKLQKNCDRLLRDLDAANSKFSELNLALQVEHECLESLYKSLRVERCAQAACRQTKASPF